MLVAHGTLNGTKLLRVQIQLAEHAAKGAWSKIRRRLLTQPHEFVDGILEAEPRNVFTHTLDTRTVRQGFVHERPAQIQENPFDVVHGNVISRQDGNVRLMCL